MPIIYGHYNSSLHSQALIEKPDGGYQAFLTAGGQAPKARQHGARTQKRRRGAAPDSSMSRWAYSKS